MPYAQIAIPTRLHRLFTYSVPKELKPKLEKGMRVAVSFRNKKRVGFFLAKTAQLPKKFDPQKIKPIEEMLDKEPIFSETMLELITWLSDYYRAPIGEVCRAALPNRLSQLKPLGKPKTRLTEEEHSSFHQVAPFQFIPEQQKAFEIILNESREKIKKPILLHGITGSGKTEIYLQIVSHLIKKGKEAILLVPEISLTPQLIGRVQSRVPEGVAVYHSGLTESWRHRYWEQMRKGEVKVAVGTRSALFAPFKNLGIIIVDEEQDNSYKQAEGNFHYHARDAAIVRSRIENVPVVLGSATPSLESYHNAKKGKYHYIPLVKRATGADLPKVDIVDLREEKLAPDSETLSIPLKEAISETLYRNEQVLLFLNRRGFANFLLCQSCGEALQCPNCSIALTYHKRPPKLLCHYCEYSVLAPQGCPRCKSPALKLLGQGTEKLEEELKTFFPEANIARLDRDTTAKQGVRNTILHKMKRGEIDILLGTQIVAKGHDFPNVTLVGIVLADTSLHLPDFRAAEKTFQLLSQAAGRSGRDQKPGRVYIQTFHPDHFTLLSAKEHDFEKFSQAELAKRAALLYPPYSRLAHIQIQGNFSSRVETAAYDLKKFLEAGGGSLTPEELSILGPAPSPVAKIRGKHRWQILIKAKNVKILQHFLKETEKFSEKNLPSAVGLQIDVDSLNLL